MQEKILNILHLIADEMIKATVVGSKAIFILFFGIWLSYFVAGRARKLLLKTLKDEMLANFLSKVAFVGIIIMAVVVTLGTMGVQTTSIIAALGAAGLAIALALKDSLSNLASGIMLVVFRPFTKDDQIEINGHIGIVEDISLFHTYMRMPDGKVVILPNTNVATSEVINYTAKHSNSRRIKEPELINSKEVIRRIDWLVGVSYTSDIDKVREIIKDAVTKTKNINDGLEDSSKSIFIGVNELQASAVEFIVRAWVVDNNSFFSTKCAMIENVKKALDANNIEIPYNKLDVNLIK
ncbi:MAG: mechanosensitive ion channel [Helicobacteraceae bacterium]|nr:mechanosensitive ion channel [Helicobacteraceae bacterium]